MMGAPCFIGKREPSGAPQGPTRMGSDIESLVLARAVRRHVEHRILLNGHRTVVSR